MEKRAHRATRALDFLKVIGRVLGADYAVESKIKTVVKRGKLKIGMVTPGVVDWVRVPPRCRQSLLERCAVSSGNLYLSSISWKAWLKFGA